MSPSSQPAVELETLVSHWQWALDAGRTALDAAEPILSATTVAGERHALAAERDSALSLLTTLAREHGITPVPWLPPGHVSPRMLGLPAGARACVFDLDGVLTDSGVLHATAWAEALDPLLLEFAHATDRAFVPFDPIADYRTYFDGRPRLDGIRLFLASRGLHVPEEDVARRKGELLERVLHQGGISALAGARHYLQAAGFARLSRAVVSASTTTLPMLRIAQLQHLVDVRVDAETMRAEGLHPRPSPDLLVAACRSLGVEPQDGVSLTHSGAGVVAAVRLGMHVIGIAPEPLAEELRGFGAQLVVPSLASLLEPPIRI